MKETGTSDLPQHIAWLQRQTRSQLGAPLPLEAASGLQKVCAVENSTHHIPLCQTEGVVPHRVKHSTVGLAFGPGPSGTRGTVAKLGGSGAARSPLLEDVGGSIA